MLFSYNIVYSYPLYTENADPVETKHFEIYNYVEMYNNTNKDKEYDETLDFDIGLIKKSDFQIFLPYIYYKPDIGENVKGIGDVEILPKYLLIEEKGNIPTVTLFGKVKLATGDDKKDLGTGKIDWTG